MRNRAVFSIEGGAAFSMGGGVAFSNSRVNEKDVFGASSNDDLAGK
jgi:hypothetical protein